MQAIIFIQDGLNAPRITNQILSLQCLPPECVIIRLHGFFYKGISGIGGCMWSFLNKLFRKSGPKVEKQKSSQSDEIRKFAKTHFVIPARQKHEKRTVFTASDIHHGLKLTDHYPQVCSSIDARKFKDFARVELIKREGPKQGASARWTFKIL